jgi:hypothetical protein
MSTRVPSQKSRKRIITSEDENDDAIEPPPAEPTSSARRADDDAAMDDLDVEIEEELEETQGSRVTVEEVPVKDFVKKEPGVRKKRKVKASETVINEKGYTGESNSIRGYQTDRKIVTRDVWKEESYSGDDEPEPESTTKSKSRKSEVAKKPATVTRRSSTDVDAKTSGGPLAGGSASGASKPSAKKVEAKKGGQSTLAGFFKKK